MFRFLFVFLFLAASTSSFASPLPGYREQAREVFCDPKGKQILSQGKKQLDDYAKIIVAVTKGERKVTSNGESDVLFSDPGWGPFGYAGTMGVLEVKDNKRYVVLSLFVNSEGRWTGFFEEARGLRLFLALDPRKSTQGRLFGRMTSKAGYVSFIDTGMSVLARPWGIDGLVLLGGHVNGQSGEDLVAALEDAYKRCGQSKGNMLDFIAHVLAPEPISSIPAPHTTLDVGVPTILSKINPGAMASCGKGI